MGDELTPEMEAYLRSQPALNGMTMAPYSPPSQLGERAYTPPEAPGAGVAEAVGSAARNLWGQIKEPFVEAANLPGEVVDYFGGQRTSTTKAPSGPETSVSLNPPASQQQEQPGQPSMAQQQAAHEMSMRQQAMGQLGKMPDRLTTTTRPLLHKGFQPAVEASLEARKQQAAAMGQRGGAVAKMLNAARTAYETDMSALKGEELKTRQTFDKEFDERKQALAQLEESGVDPQNWWNDKQPIERAMTVIGVALGGIAETMGTAKVNAASKMLDRLIERDIRAQEMNLRNKRAGLAARTNTLGLLSQKLGSIERGKQALREGMHAKVALDTARLDAKFSGQVEGAALKALAHGEVAKLYGAQSGRVTSSPNLPKYKALAAAAKGPEKKSLADPIKTEIRKSRAGFRRYKELMDKTLEIGGIEGNLAAPINNLAPMSKTALLDGLSQANLMSLAREMQGGGQLSTRDIEIVEGIVISKYDTVASAMRKMESFTKHFRDKMADMPRAYPAARWHQEPFEMVHESVKDADAIMDKYKRMLSRERQ